MAQLTQLWRHPIKSHGRESLSKVTLDAGKTMPGDRVWAVAHDAAKADGSEWAPCANFSRGSKAPQLMAIDAQYDEAWGQVTLTHPAAGQLTFDPDGDASAFLEWVKPLMPQNRAQSAKILRVPGRGMTDSPFPSISLASRASADALSEKLGQAVDTRRFRVNMWLDGLAPFEEMEWIGREIRIGAVRFAVAERITRCLATTANPDTGERDADTLGALSTGWGHKDLGVYLTVVEGGYITLGDTLELL